MIDESVVDEVLRSIRLVEGEGAEFVDARLQFYRYELVSFDSGRLKAHSYTQNVGVGFRAVYRGVHGYASTSRLDGESIRRAAKEALANAKALYGAGAKPLPLAEAPVVRERAANSYIVDPFEVGDEEKIEVAKTLSDIALGVEGVVSATGHVAGQHDERIILNSEGSEVRVKVVSTGVLVTAYAKGSGGLERVSEKSGRSAGWEHVRGLDLEEMAEHAAMLAVRASNATAPRAGRYNVVLDPEVVGLLVHEALGHASEADLVASGASVLRGRLGERIGSELVSIVDDGLHPTGYYVPFDDEGVRKGKTEIVREGILVGLLAGRSEAAQLGIEPTGNSRVMNYKSPLLVRQTNYYMLPRDYTFEEILEEAGDGIYVTAKGAGGGQVDPGTGTFTFNVGVSWEIRDGKLVRPLRGANIAGQILEVLKNVAAVGRDLRVTTGAVFGGCGKGGQLVRVGDGGPHVLVRNMSVGGR